MSEIFFHTDVTLVNVLILQGGEWPSVPWYPDTPEAGAATQYLSWFIKICRTLFRRVRVIKDFPYLNRLHLSHHIRLQRTSDILPKWGAYVEYPLPTVWGTCAMATGKSEKMGGPHIEDSLSPWSQTNPLSSSCLCPVSQHQGLTHESHLIPLQYGSCVSNYVVAADQISGELLKDMSRNVLQLDPRWPTGRWIKVNLIGRRLINQG